MEVLGRPFARAKFPRSVVATVTNAEALQGKEVKAGQPVELKLHMQCLKRGVTSPVLVHVGHGGGEFGACRR